MKQICMDDDDQTLGCQKLLKSCCAEKENILNILKLTCSCSKKQLFIVGSGVFFGQTFLHLKQH